MRTFKTPLAAAATSLLLLACGGSDDTDPVAGPAAPEVVPASASTSVTAYTEFARSLVTSETAQPLRMDTAMAPTSESDAPLPVN